MLLQGEICLPMHNNYILTISSPCYEGLNNNVPTPLLELSISKWKADTADFVNHTVLKDYIQDTAAAHDIPSLTHFNTRVETVTQDAGYWHVQTSTLGKTDSGKSEKIIKNWVSSPTPHDAAILTMVGIQVFSCCHGPLPC